MTPDVSLPSLIDAEQVGESTRETALPWDRIDGTRYQAGRPLDRLIGALNDNFEQRRHGDPDLDFLIDDIEAAEETRSRRSISLNLDARVAEREQLRADRLDRENKRRTALGLATLESIEQLEDEEGPDILLDEAATIVTDMAVLRQSIPDSGQRTAQRLN